MTVGSSTAVGEFAQPRAQDHPDLRHQGRLPSDESDRFHDALGLIHVSLLSSWRREYRP